MGLTRILSRFPGIRIATPADNEAILKFYDQKLMSTGALSLQYGRAPDFFNLLRERSQQNLVLVYEGSFGDIQGVAAFSFRRGFINGEVRNVAYLGDLRIGNSRNLLRVWRQCYAEIISQAAQLPEFHGATFFLTAVMDENIRATRALVENKRSPLRYHTLAHYNMRNIFSRWPILHGFMKRGPKDRDSASRELASRELASREATGRDSASREIMSGFATGRFMSRGEDSRYVFLESSDNRALEFLNRQNQKKPFGFYFQELPRGLVSIYDQIGQKIVATFLLESAKGKTTQIFYHSNALRALSHLHKRLPKTGDLINFLYLSLLEVDFDLTEKERIRVASILFAAAYERYLSSSAHFLSYCEFTSDPIFKAADKYLSFKKAMTLYTVSADSTAPQFTKAFSPGFEMANV